MTILRTVPALLAFAFSGYAAASGFQLLEQNASGLGNAYAGSAAVAENASTIFFNPAGMTRLQAREVSAGLTPVRPSFKFSNDGSTNFSGSTGGNGGDAGSWAHVPNAYLSWALNSDLYVGIGLSGPFGLSTEYDADWVGRFQAIKFEIKTYNINPSVAYRVNDMVSLGFGVNWQRLEAEYVRQTVIPLPAPSPPTTGTIQLDADDDAWGWNAGALFQVTPATRLGVSYRSTIKYALDGGISGSLSIPASADLEVPDTFILSATHAVDDRWELLGDLSWTGWSSIDTVNITRKSDGAVIQPIDAKFDDTWRVAVGANYKYSDAWRLKGGLAYDQTPAPDAQHRLAALPDGDRIWLTLGAQWRPTKTSSMDVGAAYLYIKDTEINNNQVSAGRGLVKGRYDSSDVRILGVQYSMSF
ncbi:MAG: OmpP1/FadL family transporter [Burkholderiaceae bacterium]|nr:OmpP1/FadL family transporter [Burkholderiaceae bacterium]